MPIVAAISDAPIIYAREPCNNDSLGSLGFCFMIDSSPWSNPNASVGKLSVTKLIHSIWIAVIGTGNQTRKLNTTLVIASKFTARRNLINFLILSYTTLPCLMVFTMVAKLSSNNTISDASLVTSVPVMPMAKPMSAALSAAASLTPSQVMTT